MGGVNMVWKIPKLKLHFFFTASLSYVGEEKEKKDGASSHKMDYVNKFYEILNLKDIKIATLVQK